MPVLFRRAGLAAASLVLATGLILTLPAAPGSTVSAAPGNHEAIDPTWLLCRAEIAKVEEEAQIPAHLLAAIALVESGRAAPGEWEISAWPWTVMAEGKGRYLPSKQAAIAEVQKLRKRGVRNIDVGCMQVNLRYHPDAFANLEEAFDPAANVAYAARFLTALRHDQGSWSKAVAHYHSATPARHITYRTKVFAAWRDERRRALRPDFATDLAMVQLASASQAIEPGTRSRAAASVGDPVTLLAALAFGRSGPVTPEIEPGG